MDNSFRQVVLKIAEQNGRANILDEDKYYKWFKREYGSLEISGKHKYLLYLYKKKIKVDNVPNSIVAYLLGITDNKPESEVEYEGGLWPDIDLDYQDTRRKETISYIKKKYGADKVAGIGTFGYMQSKGAIRNIGRALGYPYSFVDDIAKCIPDPIQGKTMTIDDALQEVKILRDLYESNKDARRIIDMAKKAEGLILNRSQHAAGVVVSSVSVKDVLPAFRNDEDFPVTEVGKDIVEKMGLVKIDILGLRTLSILATTLELIKQRHNIKIGLYDIPIDDPDTYKLFTTHKLQGVFQFGSAGLSEFAADFKPTTIEHITLLTSFFRPGPIQFKQDLLDVRNGKAEANYVSDIVKPILEPTYGFIVYQEQLMKIVQVYAGYTEHEADIFRKAVAKKIESKMKVEKEKFFRRSKSLGRNISEAERIWQAMEPFMNYGFNKSHALAYSLLTVKTAWLKVHYPVEFYTANIIHNVGDPDKISALIEETSYFGIQVLPPDINRSMGSFSIVDDKTIIFGFDAVTKVGKRFASAIIKEREINGNYKSFYDFVNRNIKNAKSDSVKNLILAGAFDTFGPRKAMVESVDDNMLLARNSSDIDKDNFDKHDEYGMLERIRLESDVLGINLTGDPLQLIINNYKGHYDVRYVRDKICIITAVKTTKTKKGKLMAFATVKHMEGRTNRLVFFPNIYNANMDIIRRGNIILYDGKTDGDSVIVNKIEGAENIINETTRVKELSFDTIYNAYKYCKGLDVKDDVEYRITIAEEFVLR